MSVKYLSWIMMLLLFVSCSSDDIESEDPAYVQVLLKNTGWHWSDKWLDIFDDWYMEGLDSYELHFVDENTGYLYNYWSRRYSDMPTDRGSAFDHFYYEVKRDGTIHLDFITHDAVDLNFNQIKVVDNQHLSCVGPDCDLLLEKMEKVDTERISEYTFKFENASLFLNSAGTMVIKGSGKLAVDGVTEENCQQIYKWQNHYVKSVEFDGDITHIGDYLFYKSNVETIKNWDSVESIGEGAFFQSEINCPLPRQLQTIGRGAFRKSKINSSLSDNLKSIDVFAFSESAMTDLSNTKSRGCRIGEQAFSSCDKLKYVNEDFISSATYIGHSAFRFCTMLDLGDLHFSSKTDSIGGSAFYGVNTIKSISFEEGIRYIGLYAFLPIEETIQDELKLPNSLKNFERPFEGFKVNKIYLGNSIETIQPPIITSRQKYKGDLYIPMKEPTITFKSYANRLVDSSNTGSLDYLWTLHVPKGSKELYQQAYIWKGFGTIVDDL